MWREYGIFYLFQIIGIKILAVKPAAAQALSPGRCRFLLQLLQKHLPLGGDSLLFSLGNFPICGDRFVFQIPGEAVQQHIPHDLRRGAQFLACPGVGAGIPFQHCIAVGGHNYFISDVLGEIVLENLHHFPKGQHQPRPLKHRPTRTE